MTDKKDESLNITGKLELSSPSIIHGGNSGKRERMRFRHTFEETEAASNESSTVRQPNTQAEMMKGPMTETDDLASDQLTIKDWIDIQTMNHMAIYNRLISRMEVGLPFFMNDYSQMTEEDRRAAMAAAARKLETASFEHRLLGGGLDRIGNLSESEKAQLPADRSGLRALEELSMSMPNYQPHTKPASVAPLEIRQVKRRTSYEPYTGDIILKSPADTNMDEHLGELLAWEILGETVPWSK